MNLRLGISEQLSIEFAGKCTGNFTQAQRHAAPYPGDLPDVAGIQGLDHLVSDVMLGVDIHGFLQNQVVLFSFCQRPHHPVSTLDDQLQLFVFTAVEVFLELTAFALELSVLLDQLTLACIALTLRQSRCVALQLFRLRLDLATQVSNLFFTLREFLLKLDLRSLGGVGLSKNAVQIDNADLELLRTDSSAGQRQQNADDEMT